MRAIDADALRKNMKFICMGVMAGTENFNAPLLEIDNTPTIQPEIIRCKDCKHYWIHKCMDSMPSERCDLEQTFYDPERDFCSLAEKREVTT